LLFEVTELFDMETRPELVMLQKTMVVVEGVARTLNPKFNMWKAAEPVVGDWIRDNLGPKRIAVDIRQGRHRGLQACRAIARPGCPHRAFLATRSATWPRSGLRFDAATSEAIGKAEARHTRSGRVALWVIALAAVWMALAFHPIW
jgi:ubiquinone biosynthesis protein